MRRAADDFHLRVMIESMSRAGRSEREIEAAVSRADRPAHNSSRRRDEPPRTRRRPA